MLQRTEGLGNCTNPWTVCTHHRPSLGLVRGAMGVEVRWSCRWAVAVHSLSGTKPLVLSRMGTSSHISRMSLVACARSTTNHIDRGLAPCDDPPPLPSNHALHIHRRHIHRR